ncbi:hypothetical protein [Moraxella lacunata]|uniref:hypothetical protein n=1 Tax=Moraxella lacunata TaxID=477 RepID=UPI003EE3A3D3
MPCVTSFFQDNGKLVKNFNTTFIVKNGVIKGGCVLINQIHHVIAVFFDDVVKL